MFFETWNYLCDKRFIIEIFIYFIIVVTFIPKFYKRLRRQALINFNEYNDIRLNYIFNHNNQYQYQHHHSCCSLYKTKKLNGNIKEIIIPPPPPSLSSPSLISSTIYSDDKYELKQQLKQQNQITSTGLTVNENDLNSNNSSSIVILPCCHDYCHCQHHTIVDNCNNINNHNSILQHNNHYNLKQLQDLSQHQQQWNNVLEEMKIIHQQNNEIISEFQGYNKDKNIAAATACNGICLNRNKNSHNNKSINCNNCQLIKNNLKDLNNLGLSEDEIQLERIQSNGLKSSPASKKAAASSYEINENNNNDQNKKLLTKPSQVTKMAKMFEKNSHPKINTTIAAQQQQHQLNENALIDKRKKSIPQIPESQYVTKRNRFELNTKYDKYKKNKENYNFENQKCYSMENLADAVNNDAGGRNQYQTRSNLKKGFDFGGSNGNLFSKPTYNFTRNTPIIRTTTASAILLKSGSGNSTKSRASNLPTAVATTTTTTTGTTTTTTSNSTYIVTKDQSPDPYKNLIDCYKSKDNDEDSNNSTIILNESIEDSSSNELLSNELLSTSPVETVDEILLQRRFSRPFSQYSISDLLQNSDLKDDDIINANFENIS